MIKMPEVTVKNLREYNLHPLDIIKTVTFEDIRAYAEMQYRREHPDGILGIDMKVVYDTVAAHTLSLVEWFRSEGFLVIELEEKYLRPLIETRRENHELKSENANLRKQVSLLQKRLNKIRGAVNGR